MPSHLVEIRFALMSRWSHILFVVLVGFLFLSFWSVVGQLRASDAMLRMMQGAGSIENPETRVAWIASSPDAADLRASASPVARDRGANHGLGVLGSLGPLLAIMWGASLVGAEFGLRTVRTKAAQTGWDRAIASKILTMACGSVAAGLVSLVAGLALQPLLVRFVNRSYPWVTSVRTDAAPQVLPQLGAVIAGCFVFALLGAALALTMRSTAGAVVAGLFLMLFVQAPLGWWWLPENAYGALLSEVIAYPAGGLIGSTPAMPANPPAFDGYPVLVLAVWAAALGAYTILTARTQEIS